jgi:hypothetical protein
MLWIHKTTFIIIFISQNCRVPFILLAFVVSIEKGDEREYKTKNANEFFLFPNT